LALDANHVGPCRCRELDDERRRDEVAGSGREHRPAAGRAAARPAVGAAQARGLKRQRCGAVGPGAHRDVARGNIDADHALAKRQRRRVGARQAIGAEPRRVVDARQRPVESGLGGFEGACRAQLVGRALLLDTDVAVRDGDGEDHREGEHHRHEQGGDAALACAPPKR